MSRRQRAENWQIAIGLQDVDRQQNSPYLLETAKEHIEGNIDFASVQKRIADYYRTEEGRKLAAPRSDEADTVAMRIQAILAEDAFAFIPEEYLRLHKRLFDGVFPHAGKYRKVNINYAQGISSTIVFLERFFENLLFQGKNKLKNRFCHILWKEDTQVQSANPKCNFALWKRPPYWIF